MQDIHLEGQLDGKSGWAGRHIDVHGTGDHKLTVHAGSRKK